MRARAVVLSVLSSAALLTFGWQLGAHPNPTTAPGTKASTAVPAPTRSNGSAAATPPASGTVSGTFTGNSVDTMYGSVQVKITVANGTISDVAPLHLTDSDGHSVSLSNRAAPVLRREVLSAQSANVQSVSGATYTSDAYLSSLQSALDRAGL